MFSLDTTLATTPATTPVFDAGHSCQQAMLVLHASTLHSQGSLKPCRWLCSDWCPAVGYRFSLTLQCHLAALLCPPLICDCFWTVPYLQSGFLSIYHRIGRQSSAPFLDAWLWDQRSFQSLKGNEPIWSRCLDGVSGASQLPGNNGCEWMADEAGLGDGGKLWCSPQPQPTWCVAHQSMCYIGLKWPGLHTALSGSVTTWERHQEWGDLKQVTLCCWDRSWQNWQLELCVRWVPAAGCQVLPWRGPRRHISLSTKVHSLHGLDLLLHIYSRGKSSRIWWPLLERGNQWTTAWSQVSHTHLMMDCCWVYTTCRCGGSDRAQTCAGCLGLGILCLGWTIAQLVPD